MGISSEREGIIRNYLSLVMNKDDVELSMDLGNMVAFIKQGQLCWQAPLSIGVHAVVLCIEEGTDAERAVLQDLIGHAREPLEALFESLVPKHGQERLEDEQARMLFHTRFGLGFVLLANGEFGRAKTMLHEMAATQLSMRFVGGVIEFPSGLGIVKYEKDLGRGKLLAALLTQVFYEEDYEEALYLTKQAAVSESTLQSLLLMQVPDLLDNWAMKCEKEDHSQKYDAPTLNWLKLFADAGSILASCQEMDSSNVLPGKSGKQSAQFLAWKFGQIAGRFCAHDRWRDNPFGAVKGFLVGGPIWGDESFFTSEIREEMCRSVTAAFALFSEFNSGRDWKKTREDYSSMWNISYTSQGRPLSEIGPEMDLYWAVRIGFADKMIEDPQIRTTKLKATTPSDKLLKDLQPEGLRRIELYWSVGWVEENLHILVRGRLRKALGEQEEQWWAQGIPLSIRQKCAQRREEATKRQSLYNYTDLIDLKEIIDKNWRYFCTDFDKVKGPDETKKYQLDRLGRLNEIRKTVMHPVRDSADEDDLRFVREMLDWMKRLASII